MKIRFSTIVVFVLAGVVIFLACSLLAISISMAFHTIFTKRSSPECRNEIVVSIVKAEYRTVTVKTESGKLLRLDQPTVKPGDKICV